MQPDLAALVGSRICHDLISPIGAIGNGVELLSLTNGSTAAEMALINDSVQNANARIRLFRIAFGAAGDGHRISNGEVQGILAAISEGGRNKINWQVAGDQQRRCVRLALLVVLCFESALPMGGEITIVLNGDTWEFTANARRINFDEALWNNVQMPRNDQQHTAAQVQFALLPQALAEADRTLRFHATETTLTAQF
ncbi:histidine phosphotransferase family protein [Loktanella sp. S4079]|uniref:histidine phosphotransferase family protein n=1 Tax=Loktanella sp. S4079 TaxID=579483 RepID=UPI0005FA21B4|nr:histidine phosphotransferase family protein [Loktanella sp. S4079]KJZ20216.1 histidine phosphotransferase [Loktanella sp. S4079]